MKKKYSIKGRGVKEKEGITKITKIRRTLTRVEMFLGRVLMLVFAGVVIFMIFSAFGYKEVYKPNNPIPINNDIKCIDGEIRECNVNGCAGVQRCVGNTWSQCTVKRVCIPGETKPCATIPNGCIDGIQTCNKCGTGYGECIPTNKGNTNNTQGTTKQ